MRKQIEVRMSPAGLVITIPVRVFYSVQVQKAKPPVLFTHKQQELFELLLLGKRRKEIADQLCLSENSVQQRASQLYRRLGVSGRDQLIRKFYGNGTL